MKALAISIAALSWAPLAWASVPQGSIYSDVSDIFKGADIPDAAESIETVWTGKCVSQEKPNIWQSGVMVFHRIDDELLGSRFYFQPYINTDSSVDFNVYTQKTIDVINSGRILNDVEIDHQAGAWVERYGYSNEDPQNIAYVRSRVDSKGKLTMLLEYTQTYYYEPTYCYYSQALHSAHGNGPVVPPPGP